MSASQRPTITTAPAMLLGRLVANLLSASRRNSSITSAGISRMIRMMAMGTMISKRPICPTLKAL
jgi:hypothetical protein